MLGNTSSPFGQKPGGFGSNVQTPTFGSPATSAFGTPQQTTFGQSATPGFGQPAATPAFGQTSSTPGFGQTNTSVFGQSTGGFGSPAAQPAFNASATQPTFGTPAAQPGFGTPSATPGFGAPAATPAFGTAPSTPAFGTPGASSFGAATTPSFGAATTTPGFGAATTTPGFGAVTSAPTFGTPTSTPSFGTATPLNFGGNQQKPTFGTPITQSQLTFGGGTTQTPSTQATGFQLGTNLGAATSTATPTLGTPTTQPSLTFPAPQTSSSLNFGTPKPAAVSFSTPTTSAPSSITFGSSLTPKPTTTQGSTGFSFGTGPTTAVSTTAATSVVNTSVGLASFTANTMSLGSVIGGKSMLTITGNTATPLYGSKTADLQAGRSSGQVPPKCQNTPTQVFELVESFKTHLNQQKHLCLEVSRASLKPISKISNDAENIKRSVMKLERQVNKNKVLESKLKEETIKALADVEIAQKAMDVPGGFPSDNSIIFDYFLQLANKFQQQVLSLRVELESTEKNILCELNPVAFTPQELSTTMQRLYECFVALAGRFQCVHAQISNLKLQHLELRRKKLEDYTDIFSKKSNAPVSKPPELVMEPSGPSPFTGVRSINSMMSSSMGYPVAEKPAAATPAFPTPGGQNTSFFGSNTLSQPSQSSNMFASPNQTAAPGTKRGKR